MGKKIVFIDQYGDRIGGGQRILFDLISRFKDTPNQKVWCVLPTTGIFFEYLSSIHSQIILSKLGLNKKSHLPFLSLLFLFISSFKSGIVLTKKLRQVNPDIIYANGGRTFISALIASILLKAKLILHIHLTPNAVQKSLIKVISIFPQTKKIISVSNFVTKRINYPKTITIHNWVERKMLLSISKENKNKKILILGQISEKKGALRLLESFKAFSKPLNHSILFVGDIEGNSQFSKNFLSHLNELNQSGWKITVEKFTTDPMQSLDNCDILINPSLVPESFGLTVIEGMARGLIVIANKVGAIPEIIQNRENGFLYTMDDPNSLESIFDTIEDGNFDQLQILSKAREDVVSRYNPDTQLVQIESLINAL